MAENKIQKLKEACYKLFELKNNVRDYENGAMAIDGTLRALNLEHLFESGELTWFLLQPAKGKEVSELSSDELKALLDRFFAVKDTDYFFQITELEGFPEKYPLGYGLLLTFALLPETVKNVAVELSQHKIQSTDPERLMGISEKIRIAPDPKLGYWLKISYNSISTLLSLDKAFEYAEESLDILRISMRAEIRLPNMR
jgi:hypothetical protein